MKICKVCNDIKLSDNYIWRRCLICGLEIDICKICILNYVKYKLEEEINDHLILKWIGKVQDSDNLFCKCCILSGLYPDQRINYRNIRLAKINRI